jgi:hypothetical protein
MNNGEPTTLAPISIPDRALGLMSPEQVELEIQRVERIAEAKRRLILAACRQTYPHDWQDMGGKPYLEGEGAHRLCAVGVRLSEPQFSIEEIDGDYFVECLLNASWAFTGQSIVEIGTCSTTDKFFTGGAATDPEARTLFNKYMTSCGGDVRKAKRCLLADVKKKALMNATSRAVTNVMGLHGVTWSDLEKIGITPDKAGSRTTYAKAATAASKKAAAPSAPTTKIKELLEVAIGSKCSVRATIQNFTPFDRKHTYTVSDETGGVTIALIWRKDGPTPPIPDFAAKGNVVFFPAVNVGEYQGNRQYSAFEVQAVEGATPAPAPPEPSDQQYGGM